jgi:tetratricopeptide (TPR) repeat protein
MKKLLLLSALLITSLITSQTDDEYETIYVSFDKKDYNQGMKDIDVLLLKYPKDDHLYFLKGLAYNRMENFYYAKVNYKKAVELNTNHPYANERLAQMYFNEEQFDQAIPFFKKHSLLSDDLGKSNAEFNLAACYSNLENYENAILHSTNVISLNNDEELLARSYWNRGLAKNILRKTSGCKDLNKGYDMFMIASRQNKVWGFSRLDADYMYNSFCDSKKVNNFRFKQWKKESKRFYKEAY